MKRALPATRPALEHKPPLYGANVLIMIFFGAFHGLDDGQITAKSMLPSSKRMAYILPPLLLPSQQEVAANYGKKFDFSFNAVRRKHGK